MFVYWRELFETCFACNYVNQLFIGTEFCIYTLRNSVPQKQWLKASTNMCDHLSLKTDVYRIVGLLCGWMVVRFIGLF